MVEIIMHNLSGLYMGPIVQIAASLVFPSNDNAKSSRSMDDAIRLMNKIIDEKPEVLDNPSLKELTGLMEEVSLFESEVLSDEEKKKKTPSFLSVVSNNDTNQ